jgi:dTDP-4-dehydrorhamnose reductase
MFLMIGANSEIATATTRLLRDRGREVVATTRRPADVGRHAVMLDFATSTADFEPPPGIAAACIFVAVARLAACEADPAGSSLINCERTIALVDRLTARGIYALFLSTNQVFDGILPHVPADAPLSPVSAYGRQKATTEAALRQRMDGGAPIGILRLAKVVSRGMALVEGWKRDLVAGRPIQAFGDMTMAPTPSDLVAAAIAGMLEDRKPAVAQLTGPRDVTYLDVGRFVARELGVDASLVEAVSALDNGMPPGATPRNTTLDGSYIATRYGLEAPDAFEVVHSLI